ncbi:hypothetical protein RB620_01485 [Paenibacillus sp. LHD-117]|uniref:hypothetical protein n=1 Tax=Paenibacillus sp. LHD-117 TaxID=3071412 RepID=UPI0027E0AA86|nr:hypothetical protein [Paenibacillus sp. LHD-117]MDQ6418099.1 hypothetical protein [Paenibacillus sp. LHD-117]
MSRSWERKVRKNMTTINKQRKKQGSGQLVMNAEKADRFTGRNFVLPVLLILFVIMYLFVMSADPKFKLDTINWVTIGAYVLLAALFFFRRPYLKIGKDYVQSRRLTGDKRLNAADIQGIRVQNGYVTILPKKGAGWTFSRLLNRFNTADMTDKMKSFAQIHGIQFEEK